MSKNNISGRTRLSAFALPLVAASFFVAGQASATAFDSGIPAGWSGTGSYGTSTADGVVTTSPEGGSYGWVSTVDGIDGQGLGLGDAEQNGSLLRSSVFTAAAGDQLDFFFNFVTSDGSQFSDYAWARLLDSSLNPVALLFTARTTVGGNSVPGFDMPAIAATITPSLVTMVPGGPVWTPLGGDSGACYMGIGQGCGYSGWVESEYTIAAAGDYILEFGVVNWLDTDYDTGLAFDGITVGGKPIDPEEVPEPASLALLGLGLAGMGLFRRRKNA
jgi:hypothetical protein